MAIRMRVYCDIDWVGDGAGGALLGQNQANDPGYGSALGPGAAGVGQTLRLQVAEQVPGGDSPTAANFTTAFTQLATDLGTMISASPNPFNGSTATALSIVQGWSSGLP